MRLRAGDVVNYRLRLGAETMLVRVRVLRVGPKRITVEDVPPTPGGWRPIRRLVKAHNLEAA